MKMSNENCVTFVIFSRLLEMAFMLKLVSVIIVLNIFSDVTNLGGRWFMLAKSPSLIFPSADAKAIGVVETSIIKAVMSEILKGEKKDKGG